ELARRVLESRPPKIDARELRAQAAPIAETRSAAIETPLELADALRLAEQTSETLRSAGTDVYRAHLSLLEAFGVDVLPKVRFDSVYCRQENDFPDVGAGSSGLSNRLFLDETRTGRFELKQPLIHIGYWYALPLQQSLIDAAEARLLAARLVLEQATAAVFYAA